MTGSETILNRIKTDCEQRVSEIALESEKKCDGVMREAEKQGK